MERNPEKPWGQSVPEVLTKYNYKDVHSVIGMTPIEARKTENHFTVSKHLHTHKRRDRVHETLKVRDKVNLYSKVKL